MQVLGISGSMREDGNTAFMVRALLDEVAKAGIETEYVSLAGKEIGPCTGCELCRKEDFCTIQDDWDGIAERMLEAEVVVLGSPTYYYDVNGQTKNFIDRTYSLYHRRRLAGRGGVAIAVQANTGGTRTVETIEGFLSTHEFISLGSVVGNGFAAGAVKNDGAALEAVHGIANRIAAHLGRT
ncbi:MAG: flavodoxin family protein [Methanospirillum sp.]|nr:flavodoxin family protein [Methanospirillum sp.]